MLRSGNTYAALWKRAANVQLGSLLVLVLYFISIPLAKAQSWEEVIKDAHGIVLEQRQHVNIDFDENGQLIITADIFEEIQYLGDHANKYSEQSIAFSNTFSEITDINAYSMVPTGKGKFKKMEVQDFPVTDSRSAGIFYDDQKKMTYLFPALTKDARSVVSYTKVFKEPRLWGYFMFSSFFPVAKSEFTVKAPKGVTLKYHPFATKGLDIIFEKKEKGKYVAYSWTAEHLDMIRLSSGAGGALHTAPHLIIHVDRYESDGETHHLLSDVRDLHGWYSQFLEGIEDGESEDLEKMVANIIEGKATEIEKVEAIYDWVQKNVKYIAIEDGLGGFRPRSSSEVFSRRYGDCKDMSNLIHNMLSMSNIPSSIAWIGTKSIPYTHTQVPTPMADNHMICTYQVGDQYYFLDATDQYNKLGVPSSHIQGREALVNKGNNDFELVDVPVVPSSQNTIYDSVTIVFQGEELLGQGKVTYAGYSRTPVTANLENMEEENKKTFLNLLLTKGNNKFHMDSVTTTQLHQKDRDLIIDYNFTVPDYVLKIGDELIVNPHLNRKTQFDLIDEAATRVSIHYPYQMRHQDVVVMDVPQDYKVDYLPEGQSYEDDEFTYSINYRLVDDKVHVREAIEINTLVLNTDRFDSWNKMIRTMYAAHKESIVLSQK